MIIYIYHNFFVHSSISGHLGCFHVLVIVNNASANMRIQIGFQVSAFVSFECISRSGIARSYGRSIFKFLRKPYTLFHSGCTNLQPMNSTRFPFFPHIHVSFLISCLFYNGHFNRHQVICPCSFNSSFAND